MYVCMIRAGFGPFCLRALGTGVEVALRIGGGSSGVCMYVCMMRDVWTLCCACISKGASVDWKFWSSMINRVGRFALLAWGRVGWGAPPSAQFSLEVDRG